MISPSQECVEINLLNDTSIEGDHTFSVSLEDLPMMATAGRTDILIMDSTDGGFSKLACMYMPYSYQTSQQRRIQYFHKGDPPEHAYLI